MPKSCQADCPAPAGLRRQRFEVGQVALQHAEALIAERWLSREQVMVLRALMACRTAALGGHVWVCRHCDARQPQYNSCRNRHCPKCQALAQHRWLEARKQRILPVQHFHVVFTVPAKLRPVFLRNRRLLYTLLFEAASQVLLELGQDPKRLGAQLGLTAVLHTWSRSLEFHPHLHCVVTGGGLASEGDRWVKARPSYLFPVRVLGKMFQGVLLDQLQELYRKGALDLRGTRLENPQAFRDWLDRLYTKRWNVYSKRPFGNVDHVFAYLGRHTHRVAISNSRLLDVGPNHVRFRTRDARDLTLVPRELLRRFLLHVLAKGFVRICHYGLLAPSNVNTKLDAARRLLDHQPQEPAKAVPLPSLPKDDTDAPEFVITYWALTGTDFRRCPRCGQGVLDRCPLPRGPP